MQTKINKEKDFLRQKIWYTLTRKGLNQKEENDNTNKVPDFTGSENAVEQLKKNSKWLNSKKILCDITTPQKHIQKAILDNDKDLLVPDPSNGDNLLLLESEYLKDNVDQAITITGAFKFGEKVNISCNDIDMIVLGSIAVDMDGNRLSEVDHGLDKYVDSLFLNEDVDIPVVTTIHPLQLVNNVPVDIDDRKVSMIVMPNKIINL